MIDYNEKLSMGISCKACQKPLGGEHQDPELCSECMWWVHEYNKDLDHPDKYDLEEGEHEYLCDMLDEAELTLEEYENAISSREISS